MDLPLFSELSLYGLALDLTPFLEADSALTQDLYPGLLRAWQQDGVTWALPARGYPFLIFYDKAAFDEVGLAYPQHEWTEAEFLEAARHLTVREGEEVQRYGVLNRTGWPMSRAFVEARAGPLIDGSAGNPVPRLGAPEVVGSVRWYADLALQEQVMPNPFDPLSPAGRWAHAGRMWITVSQKQAAMWVKGASAWRRYEGRQDVGVVPFPAFTHPGSPWWFEVHIISAESGDPEASWLWVRHLTAQHVDERGSVSYLLPTRRSVAEAAGTWAQWDKEVAGAIYGAMENASVYRLDECTLTFEMAIESIWAGTLVEDALDHAQAQLTGE